MVESSYFKVLVSDGVQKLLVNLETKIMLRDDPRFLRLKIKHVTEENVDLVEKMAQLKLDHEVDLYLRPLTTAQLS